MPAPIINIVDLDLYDPDDFFVPITIKVSDFRDIGKAKGSFSKTIKIPSTKRNDAILSYSFKITAEGFFDRNKRVTGIIARDAIETFRGSLQLKRVIIQDMEFVEYEMNLLGNNADWIDTLKNRSIRDLEYAETFRAPNIMVDSWNGNGDTAENVWPLIDYGRFKNLTDLNNLFVLDLRLAGFVKPIVRKIFKNIGYKLIGDLFSKDGIRDLIIPFTGDFVVSTEQVRNFHRVEVTKAQQDYTGGADQFTKADFDTTIADPSGNFAFIGTQETINSYVAPARGTYTVSFFADYRFKSPANVLSGTFSIALFFGDPLSFPLTTEAQTISFSPTRQTGSLIITITKQLNKGDVISSRVGNIVTVGASPLTLVNQTLKVTPGRLEAENGDRVNLKDNLPDITQIDLINAIIHKFNVRIDTNVLTHEVRMDIDKDFKKPLSDHVDWTDKKDTSQEQRIEQIEEDLKRELVFKYQTEDDDINLDEFQEQNNKEFGSRTVVLDNEFLKGSKDIECPVFAPTFMGKAFSGNLYMPVLSDGSGTDKTDWTPRLLIYGGLKTGRWVFEQTLLSEYPFAYSILENNSLQKTTLLFDNEQDDDQGLVDRFYGVSINQINKGRLKVTHYYLTEEDIATLDISKPILDNGVYYDFGAINDYLDGANESTEVETLQIV